MKNVLLIFPKSAYVQEKSNRQAYDPLSLLYISIPLIEKGFKVNLIDSRFENNVFEQIDKKIDRNTICIGINLLTMTQIKSFVSITKHIRQHYPDLSIISGGTCANLLSSYILEESHAHVVVLGEGEETFKEVVLGLEEKKDIGRIDGIAYKKNKRIICTKNRQHINLNTYVNIPYQLIKGYIQNYDYLSVLSSRGCELNCSFCHLGAFGNMKWRPQETETTILQIKKIIELGRNYILFNDENFFHSIERIRALQKLIRSHRLEFRWCCTGRVDSLYSLSEDMLRSLQKAGLNEVLIGAESGSERVLKYLNKNHTPEMILRLNNKLKNAGIRPEFSFMRNIPTETKEESDKTSRIIRQLIRDNPHVNILEPNFYCPMPNTKCYNDALKEGFIPPKNLIGWAKVVNKKHTAYNE